MSESRFVIPVDVANESEINKNWANDESFLCGELPTVIHPSDVLTPPPVSILFMDFEIPKESDSIDSIGFIGQRILDQLICESHKLEGLVDALSPSKPGENPTIVDPVNVLFTAEVLAMDFDVTENESDATAKTHNTLEGQLRNEIGAGSVRLTATFNDVVNSLRSAGFFSPPTSKNQPSSPTDKHNALPKTPRASSST